MDLIHSAFEKRIQIIGRFVFFYLIRIKSNLNNIPQLATH